MSENLKESIRCMSVVFDDIALELGIPPHEYGDPDIIFDKIDELKEKAQPVREMTVEGFAELLRDYYAKSNALTFTQCAKDVAIALSKLGTIRIKGAE